MKNLQFCLVTFCGNNSRRRTILVSIMCFIGFLTILNFLKDHNRRHLRMVNDCFHNSHQKGIELLSEIRDEDVSLTTKNVFFLETSCSSSGEIKLNARQLCAIESAAKNNPEWQVFVLFAANVGFRNGSGNPAMVEALLEYQNVNFLRLNLSTYADKTPLKDWMSSGSAFESNFVNSHLSDVLRYITLYKYGGTYLDLDVVVLKPLDLAGVNYSGAESDEDVAAGVMNFEPNGFGHQVAEMCIRDLLKNFDGYNWGNNGPGVITRVLQSICSTTLANKMTPERCYGFNVFPPSAFYAIPWRKFRSFFDESQANQTLKALKNSIVAHVWNKHSFKIPVDVGSQSAYGKLAELHCPRIYTTCGQTF